MDHRKLILFHEGLQFFLEVFFIVFGLEEFKLASDILFPQPFLPFVYGGDQF